MANKLEKKDSIINELKNEFEKTTQQNKTKLEMWMGLYSTKIREMQQTHKKQVENLQKTLPKIDKKEQLPSHTGRNTTDSNVEGYPVKTYNKHNPQPLHSS